MKNCKNYVFITPDNWDKETETSVENLQNLFSVYKNITSSETEAKPFVDVIEITVDMKEFLVNQMLLDLGIARAIKKTPHFEEENSVVLILSVAELEKYLKVYETTLKNTQTKLVQNLNIVTKSVLDLSTFTAKYLKVLKK